MTKDPNPFSVFPLFAIALLPNAPKSAWEAGQPPRLTGAAVLGFLTLSVFPSLLAYDFSPSLFLLMLRS
jgi:hypothetical protein